VHLPRENPGYAYAAQLALSSFI